jgi:hypothetical protein
MQNFDEILLHKHCKEDAYVVTHFLPLIKKYKKKIKRTYMKKAWKICPRLVVEDQDDK